MRAFPDMHALLDVSEAIWTEHLDKKERERVMDTLYRPDPTSTRVPAGFSAADEMAAFEAFQSSK